MSWHFWRSTSLQMEERSANMMFIELLFWTNACDAETLRDKYDYKVQIPIVAPIVAAHWPILHVCHLISPMPVSRSVFMAEGETGPCRAEWVKKGRLRRWRYEPLAVLRVQAQQLQAIARHYAPCRALS